MVLHEVLATLTFPQSQIKQFHQTNPHLRWGQAFHQHMQLEKITSGINKVWCDRLYYESDDEKAKAMVKQRTDFSQ